jgi:ATP-dependent helicase YprA (DUF1998 family)
MNNGQTGAMNETVTNECGSQESSKFDCFVYRGCLQSPKCGTNNAPLDKRAAVVILGELVSRG